MDIQIEDRFDPNKTGASVNIVTNIFRYKYCTDFLNQYLGTKNYISSGNAIKNFFYRLMYKIQGNQQRIYDNIKELDNCKNLKRSILIKVVAGLIQIIPRLVVGPKILDPIIIEVNENTIPYIHKVVENYISSPIRPIIVLLLSDNYDNQSIEAILKKFPVNLKVAIHDDIGETNVISVLNNSGAGNIDEFIDAYTSQCYNTCGNTNHKIILNDSAGSDLIKISNLMVRCHSALLIDNKEIAQRDIAVINSVLQENTLSEDIKMFFDCINSLNNVYATDFGGNSIVKALNISKQLNNNLLKAYVNRYAHFIPNTTYEEKTELLYEAAKAFNKSKIYDHEFYCRNNALTYAFYTDNLEISKYTDLLADAINNTPGLAGLSILYNNAGTAELYNRSPENALKNFKIGLDYATSLNRPAQRIGLIGNIAITESLLGVKYTTEYFINCANDIINMPNTKNLPFIQINGLMNLMSAALYQNNKDAVKIIRENFKFKSILSKALNSKNMGTGSLIKQMNILSKKSNGIIDFSEFVKPAKTTYINGLRADYISEHGFNPAIGNAWL